MSAASKATEGSPAPQAPPTLEGMAADRIELPGGCYWQRYNSRDRPARYEMCLPGGQVVNANTAFEAHARDVAAALSRSPAVAHGVPAGVVRDYLAAVDVHSALRLTGECGQASYDASDKVKTTRVALDAALAPDAQAGAVGEKAPVTFTEAEFNEAGEIGERDGYERAVADIDRLTGGDGEYVCSIGAPSDRHCPNVEAMTARIVERFERLAASGAAPAGRMPGVEALRRINDRLRRRNARRRERIELLTSELALAEEDADEARGQLEDAVSWPKWADACLKIIRKHSGYDGYDDASEGIDLPTELEETLGEYRQQARRKAVEARADRETARHRLEAEHYRTLAANLRAEVSDLRTRIEAADRLAAAGTGDAGRDAAPEGWALVPVDLTREMHAAVDDYEYEGFGGYWADVWTAMLKAAPTLPATPATAPAQSTAAGGNLRHALSNMVAMHSDDLGLWSEDEKAATVAEAHAALAAPSADRGGAAFPTPTVFSAVHTKLNLDGCQHTWAGWASTDGTFEMTCTRCGALSKSPVPTATPEVRL